MVDIRWPNGDPVKNRDFSIGGVSNVVSDAEGRIHWHEVMAQAVSNENDVVVFEFSTNSIPIPFPRIDLGAVYVEGEYVLDLCDEMRTILEKLSRYKGTYPLWKNLERNNRLFLEKEYQIEPFNNGSWHVAPQTVSQAFIQAFKAVVTSFDKSWRVFLKNLACVLVEKNTQAGLCSAIKSDLDKFAATEIVEKSAYKVTRELIDLIDPDVSYASAALALNAVKIVRTDGWNQRRTIESWYNQVRSMHPVYSNMWANLSFVPVLVRAKSVNPEQCIPAKLLLDNNYPPLQLEEFPSPAVPAVIIDTRDGCVTWLGNSAVTLPPAQCSPNQINSLNILTDVPESTYVWTKFTSDGIATVG